MSLSVELSTVPDINFSRIFLPDLDNGYTRYQKSGGILSEARYAEFLAKRNTSPGEVSSTQKLQASFIAHSAGFELTSEEESLYGSLRSVMSKGEGFLPIGVCDQRVLKEACIIEGDIGAVKQLDAAFPYILQNS